LEELELKETFATWEILRSQDFWIGITENFSFFKGFYSRNQGLIIGRKEGLNSLKGKDYGIYPLF